ncbi:linker for activation of T-cells family member 1 isoform X3 [Hippocampus comes]|uniref:linker for activation of T-cells family member 1 isoform X3 n=1 Tax=Hippocampus comes TaxID=109280 RepID=UPI00094EDA13|nr:PREDICTED: uncharacterized protein LOC109513750 isoform X3 [Hippocampus comes]
MDADTEASLLLPSLVSAAMLACAVVLALVCLHCRDNGPPVSIREACDTASDCVSQRSRRSDREATESESTHSYQNSHDEQDLSVSITGDYILVLPDDEAPATNRSSASTPSSGSIQRIRRFSAFVLIWGKKGRRVFVADELHDYENIPKEHTQRSPSEDRDYLNVIALPEAGETPMLSQRDDDDNDNDDDSDSDDSQGNYVNQPSVMSSSPLHDETGGAPVVPERGGV